MTKHSIRSVGAACRAVTSYRGENYVVKVSTREDALNAATCEYLILFVNGLNVTGAFELIHERIIDDIFEANVAHFGVDLREQFLQPLHTLKVGIRHPLIGINHSLIGFFRISGA